MLNENTIIGQNRSEIRKDMSLFKKELYREYLKYFHKKYRVNSLQSGLIRWLIEGDSTKYHARKP